MVVRILRSPLPPSGEGEGRARDGGVLIVARPGAAREALSSLMGRVPGAGAPHISDPGEAEAALGTVRPGLVLVGPGLEDGGPALIRRLRAARPDLPVVLVVPAGAGEALRADAVEAGAAALLRDPPDAWEVAALLRSLPPGRRERDLPDPPPGPSPLPANDGPDELALAVEPQFRRLADAMPAMLYMTDAEGRTVFTNRLSAEFTGLDSRAMESGGWLSVIHPDDREELARAEADAVRERRGYEHEYRTRRADGKWRWTLNRATPYPDREGRFAGLIGVCLDITVRREAELAIEHMARTVAESGELARIASDAVGLGTWDMDLSNRRLVLSERSKALFGIPAGARVTGELISERLHPDDREALARALEAAVDPEGPGEYAAEFRILWSDGSVRWISSRGSAFFEHVDGARRAVRIVGTSMNVTDRRSAEDRLKASLAEKETLLREIHHRVKNNLQGLWSLLQLEALQLRDRATRARFDAISNRIVVMGQIHQQLYTSNDMTRIDLPLQLGKLAQALHEMLPDPSRVEIRVDAEPLACDLDTAIPLGLVANELISNSLKHAFPAGRPGRVTLVLARTGGERVALRIVDDGIGRTGPGAGSGEAGIGSMLVRVLASQIDAVLEEGSAPGEGHRVSLLVPASRFMPC
jgi:PAS domain S-box-containing protein